MSGRAPLLATAVAGALAAAGCGAGAAQRAVAPDGAAAGPEPRPSKLVRLSDERRTTRYANAVSPGAVRARPQTAARPIARLRLETEDGPLETYLVLSRRTDAAQQAWLHIRLPGRPNGRTGWVRREQLGPLVTVTTMLAVHRGTLRATLYDDGREVWSAPIGIGAAQTPTPTGRFWIRTRLKPGDPNAAYGPWAFGTSAYSSLSDWPGGGVVGIHGTNRPELLPGRPSKGCIRVDNGAIRRLARLMPVGTPVRVT